MSRTERLWRRFVRGAAGKPCGLRKAGVADAGASCRQAGAGLDVSGPGLLMLLLTPAACQRPLRAPLRAGLIRPPIGGVAMVVDAAQTAQDNISGREKSAAPAGPGLRPGL